MTVSLKTFVESLSLESTLTTSRDVYLAGSTQSNRALIEDIKPQSTVYVNSLSDLPSESGGVRVLENKTYQFEVDITDSSTWQLPAFGRCALVSSRFGRKITYTGSGSFITENTGNPFDNLFLENLVFQGPGNTTSGTFGFKLAGCGAPLPGTSGGSLIKCLNCIFQDFETNFEFQDAALEAIQSDWFRGKLNLHMINGFEFLTSCFIANDPAGLEGAATMAKITNGSYGQDQVAAFINVTFAAKSTDTIFDIDAAYVGSARIGACESKLTPANFFSASGLDQSADKIASTGNVGIPNSARLGDTFLPTPEEVTINVVGQFEPVGGTSWLASPLIERFSVSPNGVMTYQSDTDALVVIQASASLNNVGGGTDNLSIGILKNGVQIPGAIATVEVTNFNLAFVPSFTILTNGDTLSMGVANQSDTSNIEVNEAHFFAIPVSF